MRNDKQTEMRKQLLRTRPAPSFQGPGPDGKSPCFFNLSL